MDNISIVYELGDCARCRKVPHAANTGVAMQQVPAVVLSVFASTLNHDNQIIIIVRIAI